MLITSTKFKFKKNEYVFIFDTFRERNLKPRFAEPNTIDYAIGLKWKQLEGQEKQLLDEVKRRMQYASEQLQIEIDEMLLEHQTQMLRDGKKTFTENYNIYVIIDIHRSNSNSDICNCEMICNIFYRNNNSVTIYNGKMVKCRDSHRSRNCLLCHVAYIRKYRLFNI